MSSFYWTITIDGRINSFSETNSLHIHSTEAILENLTFNLMVSYIADASKRI